MHKVIKTLKMLVWVVVFMCMCWGAPVRDKREGVEEREI